MDRFGLMALSSAPLGLHARTGSTRVVWVPILRQLEWGRACWRTAPFQWGFVGEAAVEQRRRREEVFALPVRSDRTRQGDCAAASRVAFPGISPLRSTQPLTRWLNAPRATWASTRTGSPA